MASLTDEELKKAFIEVQTKILELNRQLQATQVQLQGKERDKKRTELTSRELAQLGSNTVAYRAVGKMFIQESLPTMVKSLETKSKKLNEDISSLESKNEYLKRGVKDSETSLKELIESRKRAV